MPPSLLKLGRPALLALALAATARAETIVAASQINDVTVYSDRALVGRTARVSLPAGVTEILFEKLPASLLADSVQVAGRGGPGATILDVTTRTRYVEAAPNERWRALEDHLRELAYQQRSQDDEAAVLHAQEATLARIETASTQAPTKESPRLSLAEAAQLLTFVGDQQARIAQQRQVIDRHREALAAEKAAAERQLAELRGAGGRSYRDVLVRVAATAAGPVTLAVRYAVPDAQWSPQYDARVRSDQPTVEFNYLGLVRQNTGEDWHDVQLTLSTARPALGGGPGSLRPWWLEPSRLRAAALSDELKQGSLRPAAKVELAATAAPAPATPEALAPAGTELTVLATSATFRVPTPVTLPSDNSPQKVPVARLEFPGQFEYRTTPKLVAAAFLYAKVQNRSDLPLLTGPLHVFLDDTFVATSSLPTVMAGENFEVALGADEGVAVRRQVNRTFREDTGILTKGERVTHDLTLTVENHQRHAITVVVTDQLPVSRDGKISIQQLSPTVAQLAPAPDGTLRWTLALAPGARQELPLRFAVEHPAEVTVAGLD